MIPAPLFWLVHGSGYYFFFKKVLLIPGTLIFLATASCTTGSYRDTSTGLSRQKARFAAVRTKFRISNFEFRISNFEI